MPFTSEELIIFKAALEVPGLCFTASPAAQAWICFSQREAAFVAAFDVTKKMSSTAGILELPLLTSFLVVTGE